MKNIVISIMILLSITVQAQQQELNQEGNTTFAIKAGWLQSTLKGSDAKLLTTDGKINKKNDFFVGVSVDNSLGKYFGLKHELFYQSYGAKFNRSMNDEVFEATLEMHSFRLNPISPTLKLGGLQVYAGPYINMLLYSSITAIDEEGNIYKDHSIFGSADNDQANQPYLQKMDYGINVGIEYQFNFGLLVGVQYNRGFASLFDNSNAFGIDENAGRKNLKVYNENLGVYLGYRF